MSELIFIASAQSLNLHAPLIKNPPATYPMRVGLDAMMPRLHPGDILLADHSLTPEPGQVVVAIYADEFIVRRLILTPRALLLRPDNPAYPDLTVTPGVELRGVVTWSIHQLRPKQQLPQRPQRPDVAGTQHPLPMWLRLGSPDFRAIQMCLTDGPLDGRTIAPASNP